MLSIRVRNWCVWSFCASVPDAYAEHTHQFLKRMLSMVWRDLFQIWNFYAYAEHTRKKLMRMLGVRISSWLVCSANASVPDPYAQGTHQFLMRMLRIEGSALCARIGTWCFSSVDEAFSCETLSFSGHPICFFQLFFLPTQVINENGRKGSQIMTHGHRSIITIYGPMIYTAPSIRILMRADG